MRYSDQYDIPAGKVKYAFRYRKKQTAMTPSTIKKTRGSSQSSPSRYTLRVELLDIKPAIWRRIQVDGRVRLNAMHHILQAAMGWSDAHLHEFQIRSTHYGIPDSEYPDMETLDERKYRLNQLLDVGDNCIYLYDFGDSWQHGITVESIEKIAGV